MVGRKGRGLRVMCLRYKNCLEEGFSKTLMESRVQETNVYVSVMIIVLRNTVKNLLSSMTGTKSEIHPIA